MSQEKTGMAIKDGDRYTMEPLELRSGCDLSNVYTDLELWSESGIHDEDGNADVIVAAGRRVLLDVSPATPLRVLHIEAGAELVVSDLLDIEITVDLFIVEGKLTIGSESCPHEHRFVYTLADNYMKPVTNFLTDSFGVKVMGVPAGGELSIHGAVRRPNASVKRASCIPWPYPEGLVDRIAQGQVPVARGGQIR